MPEIDESVLIQTNKGLRPKLVAGEKCGKLTILEYVGKRGYPSSVYASEPVYRVLCDCGSTLLRTQKYIIRAKRSNYPHGKKPVPACDDCAYDRINKDRVKREKIAKKKGVMNMRDLNKIWKPTG